MRKSQRYMVNKCGHAEMLKVSNHFSARINLTKTSPPKAPITLRQRNNAKNLRDAFSKSADETEQRRRVMEMARQCEEKRKEKGDGFEQLMGAAMAVVETIPVQKRDKQGRCNLNFAGLNGAVDARNIAARAHAKTKTEEARLMLKREWDGLKKLKKRAKMSGCFRHWEHEMNRSYLERGTGRTHVHYENWLPNSRGAWTSGNHGMMRTYRMRMVIWRLL
jgi:hypothetical protein